MLLPQCVFHIRELHGVQLAPRQSLQHPARLETLPEKGETLLSHIRATTRNTKDHAGKVAITSFTLDA